MAEPPVAGAARRADEQALRAIVERLRRYDSEPWLHGEVARRMASRLAFIKKQPETVIDWGAPAGASRVVLRQAYPRARVLAVELSGQVAASPNWWSALRWRRGASAGRDGPIDGRAELLWSNMALHFAPDAGALLRRWRAALAVDGFLMFSTLGPGSLGALREIHRDAGWGPAFAPFADMHDLGDLLVEAGFADPVMDQELLTLTWPDANALLAELRGLGGNAAAQRHAGLRTPRWRDRLTDALHARRDAQGRIALDFEVVYGHAFCPPPRVPAAASTRIPLEQMRAMTRAGRHR